MPPRGDVKISWVLWDERSVDHIERHGVTPFEAEEVCFSRQLIFRSRGRKKRRSYRALGQTADGRHLVVVFRYLGRRRARVITARDMNRAERTKYRGARQ